MSVTFADALWTLLVAAVSTIGVIAWRWVDGISSRLKSVETALATGKHDRIPELIEQVKALTDVVNALKQELGVLHATLDMWRAGNFTPPHGFKVPPNTGS